MDTEPEVKVWDPLVRLVHWLVVAAFTIAYLTGEDGPEWLHVWSGYALVALILIRLLWGFVGSQHARFRDFVYSPWAVLGYLMRLPRGKAPRYLGHSPAGGAMAIALLLGLAGTTGSGLMLYAVDEGKGPLAPVVSDGGADPRRMGGVALAQVSEDEHEETAVRGGEDREAFWKEIHELLANLTLTLALLHLAGVLLVSVVHRENLVRAMFTGRKRSA